MKTRALILPALLALVALTGCAAGPTFKQYEASIPKVATEFGRIYFYRTAVFGAAIKPKIRVNGEPVGTSTAKGFMFIDRPPGDYEIATSTEAKRALTLSLEAGDERYVRMEVKMGLLVGQIKPVLVDNEVGKAEIQKTKFAGPE